MDHLQNIALHSIILQIKEQDKFSAHEELIFLVCIKLMSIKDAKALIKEWKIQNN